MQAVNEFISDSRLAFMQGKYEESLKLAKQAFEMDSNNSDAHQCAGSQIYIYSRNKPR